MQVISYGITDPGKVRPANEDSFLIEEDRNLFIVADGMGGHQGGGYASQNAVKGISDELRVLEDSQDSTKPIGDTGKRTQIQLRLLNAMQSTNAHLFQKAQEDSSLRGMGTTVIAMQFDQLYANIGHVGDSRLYILRDDSLVQITTDHSWVQEQVDSGVLTEEEALSHPLKNIITRSMGHDQKLMVDLLKQEYQIGDKYLMASDGLTNMVNDENIKKVLSEQGPEPAAQLLLKMALEAGGHDNITVVIVEIRE